MRVLVIGYGSAGKRHAFNARDLGHEVLVRDASALMMAQAHGDGFRCESWESGETTDAAIIATPAHTHYQVAHSLRSAGYAGPLFVEKPLDVTTDNADFWRSWPHPTAMVGYNWRFVEGVAPLHAERGILASTRTNMEDWPGSDYASPVLECSHDIDLVRQALGGDVEIEGATFDSRGFDIVLRAGDVTGYVVAWFKEKHPDRTLLIDGQARYRKGLDLVEPSYRAELNAFLQAAEQDNPVPDAATFEDGLAVIEIVEQAEKLCSVRSAS